MEHLIGMTDTAFLGRVGEVELGASALAGVYYLAIFMLGFGFSTGVQIMIGRRNGEGNYTAIGELFNQGFMTTEQTAAALSDMDIHSVREYEPFDPVAFERQALTEKRGLIPQIEPRYRYPYFSHIFDGGYSAGYYFYTWAEVLDKDAFEAFRESGDLFDRRIAADFRRKVLARGGEQDGMSLYRAFRGKDPDKRAMLRSRGLWTGPDPADSLAAAESPAPVSDTVPAAAVPEHADAGTLSPAALSGKTPLKAAAVRTGAQPLRAEEAADKRADGAAESPRTVRE